MLEIRELAGLKDLAIRTLPARVERIEKPAEDVAILYLKLPASERLQFLAGQYIDILMKGGVRRSYSMANAPHDDTHLQLHVRRTPGGTFSRYVFEEMKERAIVRFEGPLGSFYLREDSDKPMILVAGGTGFAPVKAVIEHAFHKGIDRQMVLYWGARTLARPVPAGAAGEVAGGTRQLHLHPGALRPAARRTTGWGARASCTRRCSTISRASRATRCTPAARRR